MFNKEIKDDTIEFNLNDNYNKESITIYGRIKKHMESLSEKDSKSFLKEIKENGILNLIKIEKIMIDKI